MDRWFGQPMSPSQLRRILIYTQSTELIDLPAWTAGCLILSHGAELRWGRCYSWDFDLTSQLGWLLRQRTCSGGQELPFPYIKNLWSRLRARRAVLRQHMMASCSTRELYYLGGHNALPDLMSSHRLLPIHIPQPASHQTGICEEHLEADSDHGNVSEDDV